MMALSRGESLRLTDKSSNTSGRKRELLAETHGSATPRPQENEIPATTPEGAFRPVETSLCRWREPRYPPSCLYHTRCHTSLSKSRIRRSSLDFALGDSTVTACIISITPPFMHTSDSFWPERVAMEGVSLLARASTKVSGISFITKLSNSSSASTFLSRSVLLTT